MAAETEVPTPRMNRILKTNQLHPYKFQMLQALSEHDPDRSIEFCGWEQENAGFRKP
jgi:hypothetical protein